MAAANRTTYRGQITSTLRPIKHLHRARVIRKAKCRRSIIDDLQQQFGRVAVMCRLIACVALICIAPVATATSCDDSNPYDLPNSIQAAEIRDDNGRTEFHWIIHRDQYCRAIKNEVLDTQGRLVAYVTYGYDDTGENARTRLANVTVDIYAPDGTFLFRELMDGRTLDASGNIVEACALLELMEPLPDSWRKPYEQGCQDARKTPAQGRGS